MRRKSILYIFLLLCFWLNACGNSDGVDGSSAIEREANFKNPPSTADFSPYMIFAAKEKPLSEYTVTSDFGYRYDPSTYYESFHTGIDLAAAEGTVISAAFSGKVLVSENDPWYGNYVLIEHNESLCTLYAHCKELYVTVGQQVSCGQKIASVGSTGNATGNHLHFEIRIDMKYRDPSWIFDF